MVAQTIALPNIRRLFRPDYGWLWVDADLAGADARVVAWETGDEDLKTAFKQGLKLHIKNARDIFPDETRDMSDEDLKLTDRAGGLYHNCKKGVHLTNYIGGVTTMSQHTKWPVSKCQEFQERWFHLHPAIKQWHDRTLDILYGNRCWWCYGWNHDHAATCPDCGMRPQGRTIGNRFGYRRIYFERDIERLLPEAVAWVPQSTVAICCSRGGIQIEDRWPRIVQILLQVHDSLDFQIPINHMDKLAAIKRDLYTTVPYDDPLTIPWDVKTSRTSWGDAG